MMARTKLLSAGDSHPGRVRQNNEDRLHLDPERGIFLVIDGIGGQAAGEKAAEIAMNRMRARLERQIGTPEERIREAITVANNEILRLAGTHPDWEGMACVLTVAVVENGSVVIGHVGDSRLYKIRRGEIRKITHDHSPVGEREDTQELSEAEAMRHPRRNEVYRDVGSEQHAPEDPDFIEVLRIPFEPDSALLLCSDGLSDQVASAGILQAVVANAGQPGNAVRDLIDAANRAGGKDNVTVLIVEGGQFAAARATSGRIAPAGSLLAGKAAMFLYGLACAALIYAGLGYSGVWQRQPAAPPPPRTLLVGKGGYGKIGEALQHARPGDTVEVSSGEYPEQIRLANGVTVKGRLSDVPILRVVPAPAAPAAAIVADGVQGARISGFRILADEQAPLEYGVWISDSDLELQDSEIVGAGAGVEIRGHSKAVLRANSITDCRDAGVRISGGSSPSLLYNAVLRNGRRAHDPGPGVLIEEPARPALIGNTFQDNGSEPVRLPDGMEGGPIQKFNFFLPKPAKPAAPSRGGAKR